MSHLIKSYAVLQIQLRVCVIGTQRVNRKNLNYGLLLLERI